MSRLRATKSHTAPVFVLAILILPIYEADYGADGRSIWSASMDVLCGSINADHIDLPDSSASKGIMAVGDGFIEIKDKKIAGAKGGDLKALLQKMKSVH